MKNKIEDLRNHPFAAMERLSDPDLTEDELKKEIEKAKTISELGKVIVESAKTEVLYARLTGEHMPEKFLQADEEKTKKIERPKANYSNKKPYEFA